MASSMADSSSSSAPQFARACRNCSVAKTKCVAVTGGTSSHCERCHRLKRVCVRDAPSQRKRKPPTAKNARLEQKLDQLVTLLSSNPPHDKSSSSSATSDVPQHTPSTTHNTTSPGPRPNSPPLAGERGSFNARPVTVACDPSELDPGDEKAAECLHSYQTYMAKYFPFVVVPSDTTVAALRDTKPFLLKAIVVVSSVQDLARQRALGHALMKEITTKLLIEGRRSVDMLQGILVWLAWYHVHFFTNPQTTNLLQLAVGLVIDLGLKRTTRAYGTEGLERGVTRSAHGDLANSELRTSDERRALLGCFYLTTIVSQWAKRYDSLRYSAQLDEVCQYLEEAREHPSDRYLVYLVRLQCIVQRIERKVPIDDFTVDTMIPIAMFVKALHVELLDFKKNIPEDLAENELLWLHYYSAETYLYEIGFNPLLAPPQYGDYIYRRLEMLNGCMQAAKTLVNLYHQMPPSHYINMPFMHFSQLTSTIIALSKLTRLECPGWDLGYAQTFIDFNKTMMKTASLYEQARSVAEVPIADNPLFGFFARKLRFIVAWNEAKLKGVGRKEESGNQSPEGSGDGAMTTPAVAPVTSTAATAATGTSVEVGGEPMQLEDISQDDLFEQLDPSFWKEWAEGDLTMWDANMQPCWGYESLGSGFSC